MIIQKVVLFPRTKNQHMRQQFLCFLFILSTTLCFSQSKKEVKEYKIKAAAVSTIENGKTINESKTIFDAKGNEIETTDYNKEGNVKAVHKTKYNSDGDEIEDEQYDANNKLVEKKITKYNSLGTKLEETFFDTEGKATKKHLYTYDNKGLKIERKTTDIEGKVLSIKKYVYITK